MAWQQQEWEGKDNRSQNETGLPHYLELWRNPTNGLV